MIQEGYKENFKTLLKAAENGDLALIECRDAKTGVDVIAICAVFNDNEGMCNTVPLAKMFDGNPYEELIPPMLEEEINVVQTSL